MLYFSRETVGANTTFTARYYRYDDLGFESWGMRVKIGMSGDSKFEASKGDLLDINLSTVIAKRGSDQRKDIVASYDAQVWIQSSDCVHSVQPRSLDQGCSVLGGRDHGA